MGNSRSKVTVLELDSAKDNCDAAQQTSPMKHSPDASSSSISFFLDEGQRGFPAEIRAMIYNELVLPNKRYDLLRYRLPFFDLLGPIMDIYYPSSTFRALALLRNGKPWENDAAHVSEVQRATGALTLMVDWKVIISSELVSYKRSRAHSQIPYFGGLLVTLKAIDVAYAMDIEYQEASKSARSWTRPIHRLTMDCGMDNIFASLTKDPYPNDLRNRDFRYTQEKFLRTTILQLRYKPKINIRIFVHWAGIISSVDNFPKTISPQTLERRFTIMETRINGFLVQLARGMTVTRLPRKAENWIRHHITLVAKENQLEFLMNRLGNFGNQVQWEKATDDDLHCYSEDFSLEFYE